MKLLSWKTIPSKEAYIWFSFQMLLRTIATTNAMLAEILFKAPGLEFIYIFRSQLS